MCNYRNARVRLRRRLETKYSVNRVSVRLKKMLIQEYGIKQVGKIPKITVDIDLNKRINDFIPDSFFNFESGYNNFVVRVEYYETECHDYKISFLVDNIDIGLERIKKYGVNEIIDNVVVELEKIYEEITIGF